MPIMENLITSDLTFVQPADEKYQPTLIIFTYRPNTDNITLTDVCLHYVCTLCTPNTKTNSLRVNTLGNKILPDSFLYFTKTVHIINNKHLRTNFVFCENSNEFQSHYYSMMWVYMNFIYCYFTSITFSVSYINAPGDGDKCCMSELLNQRFVQQRRLIQELK